MKAPAVVAIALTSALGGAGLTGWIVTTNRSVPTAGLMATNAGYVGPSSVALGAPPGQIPDTGIGITNPYGESPQAIADGKRLFSAMNCASCHGYHAEGGMGPPLNDDYWRYGGTPVEIFKSIHEGRPKGMPAWGIALPPSQIWALTAYISSLGGAQDSSQGESSRGTNSPGPAAPKPSQSGAGTEGQ